MKVLQVNTNDIDGGAAIAANRLNRGLNKINVESKIFVKRKRSHDKLVTKFVKRNEKIGRKLFSLSRNLIIKKVANYNDIGNSNHQLFSHCYGKCKSEVFIKGLEVDCINLHWVTRFIDIPYFFQNVQVPVIWTLHDMNPFTGGCHYAGPCDGYKNKCGCCPQINSKKTNDLSHLLWKKKYEIFNNQEIDLTIVAPSGWIEKEAKNSTLFCDLPVIKIDNGIDTSIFKPRDDCIKKLLEIPKSALVLLFIAQDIADKRKGLKLLQAALRELYFVKNNLCIITVGNKNFDIELPLNHLHLGQINSETILSSVYSAADLFLCPSLQDNQPNTILESFACGTPVIGFRNSGIQYLIDDLETGLLAKDQDVRSMRDGILHLLQDKNRLKAMSINCRNIAKTKYSDAIQANNYANLYIEVTERKR